MHGEYWCTTNSQCNVHTNYSPKKVFVYYQRIASFFIFFFKLHIMDLIKKTTTGECASDTSNSYSLNPVLVWHQLYLFSYPSIGLTNLFYDLNDNKYWIDYDYLFFTFCKLWNTIIMIVAPATNQQFASPWATIDILTVQYTIFNNFLCGASIGLTFVT